MPVGFIDEKIGFDERIGGDGKTGIDCETRQRAPTGRAHLRIFLRAIIPARGMTKTAFINDRACGGEIGVIPGPATGHKRVSRSTDSERLRVFVRYIGAQCTTVCALPWSAAGRRSVYRSMSCT